MREKAPSCTQKPLLAAFGAALVTSLLNVLPGGGGTIETILAAQVDSLPKVERVPVDDNGREQIEPRDPIMLAFAGPIPDLALTADAQRILERVMRLALVQADLGTTPAGSECWQRARPRRAAASFNHGAASNGLFEVRFSDGVFLERSVRPIGGHEAVAELIR